MERVDGFMGITYRVEQLMYMLYRVIVPALAGVVLVMAGFLPWLMEPLQSSITAWQIPVDVGWQLRSAVINYGLFCLLCSFYPFSIAYRAWQYVAQSRSFFNRVPPIMREESLSGLVHSCALAAWLCCMPAILWLWQYLFVDLGSIAQLAHQEVQYLLTSQHFDYSVISPLIPITNPLTFDPLSLYGRCVLLLDQLGIGPFLPLCSAALLVAARKLFVDFVAGANLSYHVSTIPAETNTSYPISDNSEGANASHPGSNASSETDLSCPLLTLPHGFTGTANQLWPRGTVRTIALVIVFLLLVICGRAPLAFVCTYQAEHALYSGDYAGAYRWFGYASELNPDLESLSGYHILRGQAWYYLHPGQDNIDGQAYLASAYLEQKAYLSAYQELNRAWQSSEHTPWLVDEMSTILAQLAIVSLPRTATSVQSPADDSAALSWFDQLLYVDPHNVFGQYMIGRIEYDLHDYSLCEVTMKHVIALSQSTNILSSAYTYLALSSDGQGDYVDARAFLLKAVSLDPKYRNNTAREELSGLR
jgi:hypothetical protein